MKRAAALLALSLFAAGCEEQAAAPAAEQGGEAAGEILPGAISDAMIPLDQIESEGPLAPRQGPQVSDLDAQQPEVIQAPGIEGPGTSEGAEAEAPAPDTAPSE
jgi:hypothetical protein